MIKMCTMLTGQTIMADFPDNLDELMENKDGVITVDGAVTVSVAQQPPGQPSSDEARIQIQSYVFGAKRRGKTTIPVSIIGPYADPDDNLLNMYNTNVGSGLQIVRSMPSDIPGNDKIQ